MWEGLLRLGAPVYNDYMKEGKRPPIPFMIFMYAEASFWLGNYEAAEEGFRIVIERFPQFNEDKLPEARITYIQRKK